MKNVILFFALIVLSGCQSKQIEEMSYTEKKALAAQIAKRCSDQGYADGHPEQKACLAQEIAKERSSRLNASIRRQNAAIILGSTGAMMQNNAIASRPTYCTSNRILNTVSTSCY